MSYHLLIDILLIIAAISFVPAASEIKADDYEKGFYASIGLGAGTYSDPLINGTPFSLYFDRGITYEGSFGYDFGKYFRVDASYTNTTSNVHNANEAVFRSYIFNGYLDVPLGDTKWTPFIGIGYGATNVDVTKLCIWSQLIYGFTYALFILSSYCYFKYFSQNKVFNTPNICHFPTS